MELPAFRQRAFLLRALTHRSYLNEHPEVIEDNERLEFLGDAVLDFLAGAFLYHAYPDMREGGLTRLRSALVNTEQLAVFARRLDLGAQLRVGRGEEDTGGRERVNLISDAFEALIGAYYLDSGLEAVRAFIEPLFSEAAVQIIQAASTVDAKSLFQEWAQAELGQTPRYVTITVSGPDHSREYSVAVEVGGETYGTGTGPNKQAATQAAARDALSRAGLA